MVARVVLRAGLVEARRHGVEPERVLAWWGRDDHDLDLDDPGLDDPGLDDPDLDDADLDDAGRHELTPAAGAGRVGGSVPPTVGWTVGEAHQRAIAARPTERRARGAFYTPYGVARRLVAVAIDDREPTAGWRVLDPTCGAGAFLLAAADELIARGVDPSMVPPMLAGFDVDPIAVAATRVSLGLWAAAHGADPAACTVVEADAIHGRRPGAVADGFDLIVGNPPFLGQLRSSTARSAQQRDRLAATRGYADAAAIVLERSASWLRRGGRMVLIQPRSVVSARDASSVRSGAGRLVGLWVDGDDVFDAAVRVCAPVVARSGDGAVDGSVEAAVEVAVDGASDGAVEGAFDGAVDGAVEVAVEVAVDGGVEDEREADADGGRGVGVRLYAGRGVTPVGWSRHERWSEVLADAEGVPDLAVGGDAAAGRQRWAGPREPVRARWVDGLPVDGLRVDGLRVDGLRVDGAVGDLADVRSDFRQWFYAVAEVVAEAVDLDRPVPVVTSGLVDPMVCRWGERPARIAGTTYASPAVAEADVDDPLGALPRLVPKLLVANQTKVIEAAVDAEGRLLPLTPLITVRPDDPEALLLLAAVVSSPVATVLAHRAASGSGLSRGAIRLTPRLIASLPLPADRDAWAQAAALLAAVGPPLGGVPPRLAAGPSAEAGHRTGAADLGRVRALHASARLMLGAYGLDDAAHRALAWWAARLPRGSGLDDDLDRTRGA